MDITEQHVQQHIQRCLQVMAGTQALQLRVVRRDQHQALGVQQKTEGGHFKGETVAA
ncbi:hypothetical protein D3C80_1960270 [compost metagenome]